MIAWNTVDIWDTGQEVRPVSEESDFQEGDPYDEGTYRDPDYYDDSDIPDEDDYDEDDDSNWNRDGCDLTEENEDDCFLERMGIK